MKKYRISKYSPIYRNNSWSIREDTWTSIFDIGKLFDGILFTANDYIITEKAYISTIDDILNYWNVNNLYLIDIEIDDELEVYTSLKEKIDFSKEESAFLKKTKYIKIVNRKEITYAIKLILRECFWAKLQDKITIEFGYDYYIYVTCEYIPLKIIEKAMLNKIFIEDISNT